MTWRKGPKDPYLHSLIQMPKNKQLALNSGTQTYQILTNDDEVCIPSLSSIFLAVCTINLQQYCLDCQK